MCDLCKQDASTSPLTCMLCGSLICLDAKAGTSLVKAGRLTKSGRVFCLDCAAIPRVEPDEDDFEEEDESTFLLIESV